MFQQPGGGWWSKVCPPVKGECYWFSVRVLAKDHSWAFDRGSPQRRISALSLLATVYLVHLAGHWGGPGHAHLSVRGITDSECNSFALLRMYIKKLPGALVHMELAAVCDKYGVFPRVSHRRRTENTWADDLSEEKFSGWAPALRWLPGGGPCDYLVLDTLVAAAQEGAR